MAVTPTNGYCTGTVLKAALQIGAADTADDDALTAAIDGASRAIDDFCGRRFWLDGSDTVRYFTALTGRCVELGGRPESADVVSVTSVEVDQTGDGVYGQTWTEGTDFVLGPRSAAADGVPYTRLDVLTARGRTVPVGLPDAVKVTGVFGWSSTPAPVERACVMLASQLFKQVREAPFGQASFDLEGGVLRMSRYLPGNVEMLLRPYRRVGSVPGFI